MKPTIQALRNRLGRAPSVHGPAASSLASVLLASLLASAPLHSDVALAARPPKAVLSDPPPIEAKLEVLSEVDARIAAAEEEIARLQRYMRRHGI